MTAEVPENAAGLTVMQAHRAADCPDRATCWAKDIHDAHDPAVTERYGVPDDPEATEHLRTQLVAITEAERKALYDASHFIAASSDLPGVQGLASTVLNVANRGGVNAD